MPAGASTPNQARTLKPSSPCSATVGRSGKADERCAAVTAIGRTLPLLMKGSAAGTSTNISCTWPDTRSVSAGTLPRYGTCSSSTPAASLNSWPDRCCELPLPADP
ncbi:Uncharacterised protein [Bordetella pertussis]|nr:Uncharacterised protein [Bordetella pertussis]